MTLEADLKSEVATTFRTQWTAEAATVVPLPNSIVLKGNHAKHLPESTVLYADLDGSTNMVDTLNWGRAAEVYKTYLRCASAIIKNEGGTITAYDGDRVMAIFTGDTKNSDAVEAALKINYAVIKIIRPAFAQQYPDCSLVIKHVIGIDTGGLRAARVGVHGDNDLVWVGSAANHAAKLCALSQHPIWITKAVHDKMNANVKNANGKSMWTPYKWTQMKDAPVYASDCHWGSL